MTLRNTPPYEIGDDGETLTVVLNRNLRVVIDGDEVREVKGASIALSKGDTICITGGVMHMNPTGGEYVRGAARGVPGWAARLAEHRGSVYSEADRRSRFAAGIARSAGRRKKKGGCHGCH